MEKLIELNSRKNFHKMGEDMKNIASYEEIAPLLRKYLKKGLITNHFMNADEYKYAISKNKLSFYEWNGGNIFLNHKDDFYKLTYQLLDLKYNLDVKLSEKIVIEITKRQLDDSFYDVVNYWKENGFNDVLNRIRLSQEKLNKDDCTLECENVRISLCTVEELCNVNFLLTKNFNKYTGCLPDEVQLEEFLKCGFILGAYINNNLVGILHFSHKRGLSEIRHLCVNKEFRKMAVASLLISAYHSKFAENRKYVWCAKDNYAAKKLYKNFGYCEDGWESTVLANFDTK